MNNEFLTFVPGAETIGIKTARSLFAPWDLTILVTLFPRCTS